MGVRAWVWLRFHVLLCRGVYAGPLGTMLTSVAFSVLDDVFVAKRLILACTGYVALILTFFFATLLHFTEKDNDIAVGHLTMGDRYTLRASACAL